MLTNPDEKALRALENLSAHDDFKKVLVWLGNSHAEIQDRMENELDETRLRQQQGASQVLSKLFGELESAKDKINRIREKPR